MRDLNTSRALGVRKRAYDRLYLCFCVAQLEST